MARSVVIDPTIFKMDEIPGPLRELAILAVRHSEAKKKIKEAIDVLGPTRDKVGEDRDGVSERILKFLKVDLGHNVDIDPEAAFGAAIENHVRDLSPKDFDALVKKMNYQPLTGENREGAWLLFKHNIEAAIRFNL